MGDTKLADIPGNIFNEVGITASVGSAANLVTPLSAPRQACTLLSADIIPTASQAGSATNFADLLVVNLGSDGNGTTVLASYTLSATGASIDALAPGACTVESSPTVAAGEVIGLSIDNSSNGNGIDVGAATVALAYRLT